MLRCEAAMFQRQHGQHRRIPGRADSHGVLGRKGIRDLDQPLAFHASLLRVPTVMSLAQPPAVDDNAVSHSDAGIRRRLDRTSQIDSGDQGWLIAMRQVPLEMAASGR